MRIRIHSYNNNSMSGLRLGSALGVIVNNREDVDFVINWGSSKRRSHGQYINTPEAVARAIDKYATLQRLKSTGVPHVQFTRSQDTAQKWWDEGKLVVCRVQNNGARGEGIVLSRLSDKTRIVPAPLYTKHFRQTHEYRIHVVGNTAIDIQEKRKSLTFNGERNNAIRVFDGGWVLCRQDVHCPYNVVAAGVASIWALGLDFGAVDIGYDKRTNGCAVFEINTAPWLIGTTLSKYVSALIDLLPPLASGGYARRREETANI